MGTIQGSIRISCLGGFVSVTCASLLSRPNLEAGDYCEVFRNVVWDTDNRAAVCFRRMQWYASLGRAGTAY